MNGIKTALADVLGERLEGEIAALVEGNLLAFPIDEESELTLCVAGTEPPEEARPCLSLAARILPLFADEPTDSIVVRRALILNRSLFWENAGQLLLEADSGAIFWSEAMDEGEVVERLPRLLSALPEMLQMLRRSLLEPDAFSAFCRDAAVGQETAMACEQDGALRC